MLRRFVIAEVWAVLLIACLAPFAAAQTGSDLLPLPTTTFAQPTSAYAPSAIYSGATLPYAGIAAGPQVRAAYDDHTQAVVILDGPGGGEGIAPGAAVAPGAAGGSFAPPPFHGQPYSSIAAPALPPDVIVPGMIDYSCEPWHWQLLPQGLIWHSYLASPEEPRLGGILFHDPDLGTKLDGILGARVGLLRYGTSADYNAEGWEFDVEGAAFIRQDLDENSDVDAYDFRIGFPLTYGIGRYRMKIAWYHTSAHIGDEYQIKHPDFVRINYSRNAIVWGHAFFPVESIRIYGEVDYGYWTDGGNEPWFFQFGVEYSPVVRGPRGAPFVAMNGLLREENDFGGPFTFETGWQWRGQRGGQRMRLGFHYQTGPSTFDEFYTDSEQQIGGGIWYDF